MKMRQFLVTKFYRKPEMNGMKEWFKGKKFCKTWLSKEGY